MKPKYQRRIFATILFLLFGIVSFWPVTAFSQTLYTIVDLGTLGGDTSIAFAMNQNGRVVGKSKSHDGSMKAFCWDETTGMTDIGPGEARAINDAGQVVGNIHHHTDDAFVWDSADGLAFLNKGDFLFATAYGINSAGQIVGYARKFNDIAGTQAILWDPAENSMDIVGTSAGPNFARDINSPEEVVGNLGAPSRAFLWNLTEGMRDLGTLDAEEGDYFAMAINDKGQATGYVHTDSGEYRTFLWEEEYGMRLLTGGGDSMAYGMNRFGHVVGASGTMIGLEGKAYLWKNGERIDLNNAIFPESGWDLREARDINDRGQICGSGLINGEIHAYLLTPIVSVVAGIQVNGSNTKIRVSPTETVSVTVGLNPGEEAGRNADWWIAVLTPFDPPGDWYTYVHPTGWFPGLNLCIQPPFFDLSSPFEVLNTTLPEGEYVFFFGVDPPDGSPAGPWWGFDYVEVQVRN
jgi:probable HAF family extracellular repeat protein